jgi:hypothetical protein
MIILCLTNNHQWYCHIPYEEAFTKCNPIWKSLLLFLGALKFCSESCRLCLYIKVFSYNSFKSYIKNFELIFLQDKRQWSSFSFLHVSSTPFVQEAILSPVQVFSNFVKIQMALAWGKLFLDLLFYPIDLSTWLFLYLYHVGIFVCTSILIF